MLTAIGAVEDLDPVAGRLLDYSASVRDDERDLRDSLDWALIGLTPREVEEQLRIFQHVTDAQRAFRRAQVAAYAADPTPGLARFPVDYIVTDPGHSPPAALGGRVGLEKEGRTWDLWRVRP